MSIQRLLPTPKGGWDEVLPIAHQGGWDEVLLVAGPLVVLWLLLVLANRRAKRLNQDTDGTRQDA